MTEKEFKKINKLWKLLKVALEDVEKVRQDKRYKLDMAYWHKLDEDKRCFVCLAGSVLANWTRIDRHIVDFGELEKNLGNRLSAIDELRRVNFFLAYNYIHNKRLSDVLEDSLAEKFRKLRTNIFNKARPYAITRNFVLCRSLDSIMNFKNFNESLSFYKWLEAELKELNV